jgi:hypothetical protein
MKPYLLMFAFILALASCSSSDRAAGNYEDHPVNVPVGSAPGASASQFPPSGAAAASYAVDVRPADALPANSPPKPAKDVADKLRALEMRLAADKGEFDFFALFLREDVENKWDLLVSAPWLEADRTGGMQFLLNQVRSQLEPDELLLLSRVILVEDWDPTYGAVTQAIRQAMTIRHAPVHVVNSTFNGLLVKDAYVIMSLKRHQGN